jgi:excisionase family DNA binding protein
MSTTRPSNPSDSAPPPHDEANERLLTTAEAPVYLRVSKSYLDKLRVYGGGPPFLRPGKRKVLYRKSDLDTWLARHRFGSTSEYRTSIPDEPEC